MSGWIGVDLDGTLAHYDKWVGPTTIGAPIVPMVERVKAWLREGKEVRIFTARAYGQDADSDVIWAIRDWCRVHIESILLVTCQKDLDMIELWDDRCVQVEANTGEPVTYWQSRV